MPRLSVDIDLTYLPVQGREQSLAAIDAAIRRIEQGIKKSIHGSRTTLGVLRPEGIATKLLARAEGVQIRIEVTPVLRGSVYPVELRAVSSSVEEAFGFAETRMVALYAVWYNFIRIHKTLRVTPALEAGVTDRLFTYDELVRTVDEWEASEKDKAS